MRKIYCGTSGSNEVPSTHKLSEVPVSVELLKAVLSFYGTDLQLRPAQDEAVFAYDLLADDRNAIISTPTNSGKSLLSYLLLLNSAIEGKTVVLIEPLRALAYEKYEELKRIVELLKRQSKIKIGVTVTTGDYRLNDEFMHSAIAEDEPGSSGRIVIATPERLDALSRVPENKDWFKKIALVCFDEAHLIGDANRGATLELLIAFLRSLVSNLRIVLMSATISNSDELAAWLDPCIVISDVPRYPTLDKWIYCIEDGEDTNQILINEIREILAEPDNSVLLFVYQIASAESLAQQIASALSGQKIKRHDLSAAISAGVAWFHSKLSAATKESVIQAMERGQVRVTVSTTALSMGINLPATHVFVRDISFTGYKDLDISDLMQMIGRAGRGNKPGTGVILLSNQNLAKSASIAEGIENEVVPEVKSRLIPVVREDYYGTTGDDLFYIDRVGNQMMGILNRCGTTTMTRLNEYLSYTLGGSRFEDLPKILRYLSDWKLAYFNEDTNEYQLTHLGKVSSHCYLPPVTAANMGQLMRDLLSDKPDGTHILQLTPIDYLIILCLVSNENKPFVRYSKALAKKIDGWMEALPLEEKSYLYRTWIVSAPDELLGSASVTNDRSNAEKYVYQCTYTAMMIYDLSKGMTYSQINDFYGADIEEIQERLRDNAIWILCGFEQLMEVKSFYFHLKNNCDAESGQIQSVDKAFKRSSKQIFGLVADLKFRSRLGELVRGIKRVYPHATSYPGEGAIRKLEENGIIAIKDLIGKTPSDLTRMGIRRDYADLICGYIKKRMA